ncbi:uncharacterized protein [Amphiura filiformis]|uniref:uncharacterized protein isoform X3 n=1 Tax=Amphiura filiformis TaxID=82378 RepID=UPI003B216D69
MEKRPALKTYDFRRKKRYKICGKKLLTSFMACTKKTLLFWTEVLERLLQTSRRIRLNHAESPNREGNNGPGYYVDTNVSSSSSNDGVDGTNESIPSTPTGVIQHPAQLQDRTLQQQQQQQQQQQLSANITFQQAAAAQQAAQLAANAAALQAAQAQEAMAAAVSQTPTNIMSNVPQSMAAMSLHQTVHSASMPMSCMANGVINSVTSISTPMQVPNLAYSDGSMGGIPVPMMMHQADPSQPGLIHHPGKGNKDMPPTPPGELSSADEKDHEEKKKIMMNIQSPNITASSGSGPIPVAFMHLNGQNAPMHGGIPGPPGPHHAGSQGMHQFGGPAGHMMGGVERMPVPMPPEAHAMYNPIPMPDVDDEEELSPEAGVRPRGSNKRRNNKKPVAVEDKDDKYFERRKRNNMAAKRSRDARKHREDTIAMRANYLERENAILRAQLATLREEANSLRQLLSQRTMTTMTVGPNGQQINTLQ